MEKRRLRKLDPILKIQVELETETFYGENDNKKSPDPILKIQVEIETLYGKMTTKESPSWTKGSAAQYSAQYWIFEILISCIKFYLIVVQIIL